jgi:protein disulfide-isomerase
VAASAAGRVDSPYADINVPATAAKTAPAPVAPQMTAPAHQPASSFAAAAPLQPAAAPATPAVDPSSPYANVFRGQPAPANLSISPATTPTMHVADPAAAAAPPQLAAAPQASSNPPLGLDGYCPVELVEHKRWVKGDARWGAIHNGRTYLFSGPAQQQKFLPNGEVYAPVMSGGDPVVAVDHNQQVEGKREYGVFYNRRIYLFSDPGSRDRFSRSPERYNVEMLQARRTTPGQSFSR